MEFITINTISDVWRNLLVLGNYPQYLVHDWVWTAAPSFALFFEWHYRYEPGYVAALINYFIAYNLIRSHNNY